MFSEHRFALEKGSKKYHCPQCGKKKFVRFIDKETEQYLPEQYGRCDREDKCNYNVNPYSDGYAKTIWEQEKGIKVTGVTKVTVQKQKFFEQRNENPVFFDFETFKHTLKDYEENVFIQNLLQRVKFPFPKDEVTKVIQLYRLGTISKGYRLGAITFPFIDYKGNVRTVQVKQFDEFNHTIGTDFLHSIIERELNRSNKLLPEWLKAYSEQEKRVSCLFGEHLLKQYPNNPIALVEAPKTAIYGTLYFGEPETSSNFIWLAVYNKSSFSFEKLKALQGKNVFVFPDLSKDGNTFKEWEAKAKNFESQLPGTKFIFSDLLERLANQQDRENGNDIADILIKQDWKLFRQFKTKEKKEYSREERVLFGLHYYKTDELKDLRNRIFINSDYLSYRETIQQLYNIEGLNEDEANEILDVLCLRGVMKFDLEKDCFSKNI